MSLRTSSLVLPPTSNAYGRKEFLVILIKQDSRLGDYKPPPAIPAAISCDAHRYLLAVGNLRDGRRWIDCGAQQLWAKTNDGSARDRGHSTGSNNICAQDHA